MLWDYRRICRPSLTETSLFGAWLYFISTLSLLTWRKWWAPNNASSWQMGFNSAFEGLIVHLLVMIKNPNNKFCEMFFRALSGNTSKPNYGLSPGVFMYALSVWGTAVAQWLRWYTTNRKVAHSIPAGVIGIFYWHKILPIALWPWDRLSL